MVAVSVARCGRKDTRAAAAIRFYPVTARFGPLAHPIADGGGFEERIEQLVK
jgi:hypothetical protein